MPQKLIGRLAVGSTLCAGLLQLGLPAAAVSLGLVAASATRTAVAQDSAEITRFKAVDLMKRARQAMTEGNFETADSLVSRAEALNANFGMMYFGDTPKKVRRDLDKVRSKGGAGLPSQKFTPSTSEGPAAERKDPFAANPATGASGELPSATPGNQAKAYLNKARAEMAQGNITGATHWHTKAVQAGGQFQPNEDSPERLAADIRKAGGNPSAVSPTSAGAAGLDVAPPNLSRNEPSMGSRSGFPNESPFGKPGLTAPPERDEPVPGFNPRAASAPTNSTAGGASNAVPRATPSMPTVPTTPDADRRVASDGLLLAARRSLAVGDVRRATEAINQAKALRVNYDFHEDNPAKVEAAIARFVGLTQRPAAERDGEEYRRSYAELQMQQADDLLRWRDFDEAERLANEAKRMGIVYSPFDAKPDTLLQRIAEARRGQSSATPNAAPAGMAAPGAMAGGMPREMANTPKARALELTRQARAALDSGNLDAAEQLAQQAESLRVPDAEFNARDDRAFIVLMEVKKRRPGAVSPAAAAMPIGVDSQSNTTGAAQQAVYEPGNDTTRNVPATAVQVPEAVAPGRPSVRRPPVGGPGSGMNLFMQGEEYLQQRDIQTALDYFREAYKYRDELDPTILQKLQDRLQMVPSTAVGPGAARSDGSAINEAAAANQLKFRQVSSELARQESLSQQVRDSDPKQAKVILDQARELVEKSQLDTAARDMLLRRVDRSLQDLGQFVENNRGKIELNERNTKVRADIEREEKMKVEVQTKLAELVDEFNKLMDEQRYAEAEVLAKKAGEMAPEEPVVVQLKKQSNLVRALQNSLDTQGRHDDGYVKALHNVERSAEPFDDSQPIQFGDLKDWKKLTDIRRSQKFDGQARRTARELEIQQKLKAPVSLSFKDAPLSVVMDHLAKLADVNLHLDPRGLAEEGVTSDTPVTIDLAKEVMLKSALSLVLEPLHLSYVIKDEVLKITSEQLRDGEVFQVTYNVADLVIPIPNFVPNGNLGMSGALRDAHANLGIGGAMGVGGTGAVSVVASRDGAPASGVIDPKLLGQFGAGAGPGAFGGGGPPQTGMAQNIPFGPGGAGGGAAPDFDSLVDLITSTIAPTTWSEVGGAGAVKQFPTNLSLVISQTQEVHEEIAELLEQLRRLQDLQVTVEVRFLTLADTFLERVGVDMNIKMNDRVDKPFNIFGNPLSGQTLQNFSPAAPQAQTGYGTPAIPGFPTGNNLVRDTSDRDLTRQQSVTVGMQAPGTFSNDLDIPFTNGTFGSSFNSINGSQFNNLNGLAIANGTLLSGAGGAALGSLGFAILSDLEAYFFIQAIQSDVRTNVLQAPKVTLFNGQQAFVSDTQQVPFVISVIPVVGDFAAAQQPVIIVLSEGTHLTVQAVVSSDRRFVRLTVIPFFSNIGAVNTFTFTGSTSTTRTSASAGPNEATVGREASESITTEGSTVQLPTFQFTTVTTTVSVPDGGTVLLGGIKRLNEFRNEMGIPVLSKIPYINRLFANTAQARRTQSLMMMVTPRIIIQEEEEALLGVNPNP